MREHELIYVIQPDAAPEREQEIHDRVDGVIGASKGQILLRDDWGKRKLAYEISKYQKGHYFQLNFLSDGACVSEIERGFRIDADLIRFLTVKVSDSVPDIDKRVAEAKVQATEQAERRAERERLEAEREQERAEAAAALAANHAREAEAPADAKPAAETEAAADAAPDAAAAADAAPVAPAAPAAEEAEAAPATAAPEEEK